MLPSEYLVCCDHWSTSRCRLDYVRLFDARTSLILTRLSSMCICTVPLHKWWLDNTVEILAYFSSDWSDRLFCWELQYLPISSFFVDCLANLHFFMLPLSADMRYVWPSQVNCAKPFCWPDAGLDCLTLILLRHGLSNHIYSLFS